MDIRVKNLFLTYNYHECPRVIHKWLLEEYVTILSDTTGRYEYVVLQL